MVALRKRKAEEPEDKADVKDANSATRPKRARKAASTTTTIEDEAPATKKKSSTKATATKAKATKKGSTAKSTEENKSAKKATKKSSTKSESEPTPATKKTSTAKSKEAAKPAAKATKTESKTSAKSASRVSSTASNGRAPASRTSSAVARATLIAAHARKAAKDLASHKSTLNQIPSLPTELLNVYVFGSGSICELGLGPLVTEVKRPRLNPLLPIEKVGIVKVAVGGTHVLCIDKEGRLWSWGQNDCGVLGRATKENNDEVDDEWIINSKESTPNYVENLPESAIFVDIAASDNLSAAVTDEGHLYAWGTFNEEGRKSYKKGVEYQREPAIVTSVRGVVQIAAGKDHLLILDKYGEVYAWGVGTSNQLGVPVNNQLRTFVFGPLKVPGVKNIKSVAAGEFHSFAIDHEGHVFAWGLNNFGQAGLTEPLGEGALLEGATEVTFFAENKLNVTQIACGNHHTLALTDSGDVYAFGETYLNQLGIPSNKFPESLVRDKQTGAAAYVPVPTKLEDGVDNEESAFPSKGFKFIASGTEHCLAISADDGSAWTWGSGSVYQLGHGKPAGEDDPEDEPVPTKINNTATRGVNMVFAGAGAQFSVLAGLPREPVKVEATNGTATNGDVNEKKE